MSVNPYEAPKAKVADAATLGTRIPLAGRGARFVNLILDAVFSTIVSLAFGVALGMAGAGPWFARLNRFEAQLIDWVFYVLYYTAFELSFGWTLAKLITGTRVVDERGERPSPGKIVGRSFARLVPFEPLSFLGKTGIGWHDRWSGTRVVSVRRTSGATLEDSFKPGFDGSAPRPAEPVTQAFVPTDGPPAWCPNCAAQISATTERCGHCGADFTSPEGWKPLPSPP